MPLDGADRTSQDPGEGLHLGPAEAGFIVGVVAEGAVGGDRFGRDPGLDQVVDLGYTGKSRLRWHIRLLFVVRRCA